MSAFADQINAAIGAHGQWKVRLQSAISTGSSEFQVATVAQDNQCAFGKWLYGDGKIGFPSDGDYRAVRELHADFHRQAAQVLGMAVSGRVAEARAAMGLGSGFSKASSGLISKLMLLQKAAA